MGGSFDPVHLGHLRVALDVLQTLSIPRIKFIPCQQQVLKIQAPLDQIHRLAMLKLAIDGVQGFEVDERELNRPAPSYTVDTLQALRKEYPTHPLCFILGGDAAKSLEQWYHWPALFDLAHLIIVSRPAADVTQLPWL
ncbi:MAG: nicotinate (nicotinamide) nucleotide adenylyltransferase, partial [Gammaproteobacteria bacterium]|nr:nicotinate (nicotinamide) nucleotide adenylyltransferase [Gammaproteobacteria bacterium]